jgi:hypothetical protein
MERIRDFVAEKQRVESYSRCRKSNQEKENARRTDTEGTHGHAEKDKTATQL